MAQLRLHSLSDGRFRLDGGAMFGVVPRVLWERGDPADAENRILLGLNCLLVEGPGFRLLIDTGLGDKEDARFLAQFPLERTGDLFSGLAACGLSPADVTHVVNTHLHFDHCGGNTRLDAEGRALPSFPAARYFVQRGEWEDAVRPHALSRASYLARNFLPVAEAGLLERVDGEVEILPGVRLLPTPGHTPHHQSVLIDLPGGRRLFYPGDLIPTSSHLPLAWIMSYDLQPLVTLETKARLLARQRAEDWFVYFEHERAAPSGRLLWTENAKGERAAFQPLPLDALLAGA
ncbi:MBL fold metallo-hydrolase [bacterium]|nr:MBL fold metallo-hydrolase [bacterium]